MDLNGINQTYGKAASAYAVNTKKTTSATTASAEKKGVDETAVIFEASKEGLEKAMAESKNTEYVTSTKDGANKTDNFSIKEFMKASAEERSKRMQQMIQDLLYHQSTLAENLIKLERGTLDPKTIEEAKESVSEDGYWGAEKTSDRMIEFAVALAGDDPQKLEEMKEAFLKGYKQAEKAWGGELPELCQQTRDLTIEKFDKLIKGEE